MIKKNFIVYMHVFPNKKVYIGITCQKPNERWRNGKGYKKSQIKIRNAINKYGWENIEHKVLYENLTKEEAEQKEIELISFYNSNNKNKGFNKSKGGRIIVKQKTKIHKKTKSITIDEEVYKEIELLCVILNRNFSNFVESLLKEELKEMKKEK